MENIKNLIKQTINKIENTNFKKNNLTGIPSGLTELDRITSGWQKSELTIIGARPGMGSTDFAFTIARNAAIDFGKSVAIFSSDDTAIKLTNKLIAIETGITSFVLDRGLTWWGIDLKQFNLKIEKLAEAPLFIEDVPRLTVLEIQKKILILKENIDLIIIENIEQIIDASPSKRTRKQEIASIISSLKVLAKEINVPIIVLMELPRSIEKEKNSKPRISSNYTMEMGRNASTVIFIYRPEYYSIDFDENGNKTMGITELIIVKVSDEWYPDNIVRVKYEHEKNYFSDYKTNEETHTL